MKQYILSAAMALSVGLSGAAIAKQDNPDACPQGKVCVDYQDIATIQIDPTSSFMQAVVVGQEEKRTTMLDGTTSVCCQKAIFLPLISNGDSFDQLPLKKVDKVGPYADAENMDVYVLTKQKD